MNPNDDLARTMREGIVISVLVLAVGSFSMIGASANAPLLRSSLGLSAVGVGAIASVAYLGAMSSARPAGRVTDQLGPGKVIAGGLGMIALGDGIALSAVNAFIFYLGILVLGVGYGVINPPTTVLSNPSGARRRGLVMSVKQSGVPLGGMVAGAVVPTVGLTFGWRAAFALALGLCGALAAFVLLRGGYEARPMTPGGRLKRGGRRLRLPHGYLYGLMIAGVQVSIFAFTAVYLVEARGLSNARAGLGVSVLLVGGVAGRLAWGWLSDVHSHRRVQVLQAVAALGAVAIIALLLSPEAWLPLVLVAVGMTSVGWNGVYIAAVAESADPAMIGSASGTALTLINLGAIVVPLLTGVIVSVSGGWVAGLLWMALLSLAAAVVAVAFSTGTAPPAVNSP